MIARDTEAVSNALWKRSSDWRSEASMSARWLISRSTCCWGAWTIGRVSCSWKGEAMLNRGEGSFLGESPNSSASNPLKLSAAPRAAGQRIFRKSAWMDGLSSTTNTRFDAILSVVFIRFFGSARGGQFESECGAFAEALAGGPKVAAQLFGRQRAAVQAK